MELKAKTVSLFIKIIDVAFLILLAVLKWCGKLPNAEIKEICLVAGVMGAVFGDISINSALDKFTGKENGNGENSI